jgi:hypothetical protein
MSLIICSSSQREHENTSQHNIGIEDPSSFQNFFKSPLKVDRDSEVAVVSIKCSRNTDTVVVNSGDGIFFYWGAESPQNMNDALSGFERPTQADDINSPLHIMFDEGTYTTFTFANHLEEKLNDIVKKAYKEVSSITVSEKLDGNNAFDGFTIQLVQVGNGSGLTDKPSAAEFKGYIESATERSTTNISPYTADEQTDNFVASASGTDVLITGHNPAVSIYTAVCDVIGKAHPLSQVNSQCVIYFNGSSASNTKDGYTLGLVRSQGRTLSDGTTVDYGAPSGISMSSGSARDKPLVDASVNLPPAYTTSITGKLPPFFWDVAFNWVNGSDGQVIHYVNNGVDDTTRGIMKSITLANTPTNASLEAKYWDRVIFEVEGETVSVKLGQTGKGSTDDLVTGLVTTFGSRVKPLGITCNQLYPKIAIENTDDTTPGTAWLNTYNGHSSTSYYENNYFGYYIKAFGRQDTNKASPLYNDTIRQVDLSSVYADGTKSDGSTDYTYKGQLSGNKGIDNKWTILSGGFEEVTGESDYFRSTKQAYSIKGGNRLQNILGFRPLMNQTTYGTSADNGADITFESVQTPAMVPTSSMFVRLKNQALNTYNGNKQSISNIVYTCPRFDAQGNTAGLLFYEPSERVYVKFNNPSEFVLNSLDIDIVDVNEKPIQDLVGNTLVTLHIRKSR